MRRPWLVVGAALWLSSCSGPRKIAAPPPPPALESAAEIVPADLDLVLRADLARLRTFLGPDLERGLERLADAAPSGEPDHATARLLLDLLGAADTAWVGVRPGLAAELTDNVVVLRGDLAGKVPTSIGGSPPWRGPRDLGGGVLKLTRDPPPLRAAPAVLYMNEPSLVVLGSTAEIDALERTVERGAAPTRLRPPETGLVSVAARLRLLEHDLRDRAPGFSRLVREVQAITASLDLRGDELLLEAELELRSQEKVPSLVGDLRGLFSVLDRGSPEGLFANTKVEGTARFVSLRTRIPSSRAAAFLRCRLSGSCS